MTNNLFDISGRVALVTGGRRGLGLAMSEGLAAAGAKLACIDIADECDELRKRVEARGAELDGDAEDRAGAAPRLAGRGRKAGSSPQTEDNEKDAEEGSQGGAVKFAPEHLAEVVAVRLRYKAAQRAAKHAERAS